MSVPRARNLKLGVLARAHIHHEAADAAIGRLRRRGGQLRHDVVERAAEVRTR